MPVTRILPGAGAAATHASSNSAVKEMRGQSPKSSIHPFASTQPNNSASTKHTADRGPSIIIESNKEKSFATGATPPKPTSASAQIGSDTARSKLQSLLAKVAPSKLTTPPTAGLNLNNKQNQTAPPHPPAFANVIYSS